MASTSASSSRPPILLTLVGVATIGAIFAMPGLAGPPDGDKVPDLVRFIGRFHPLILHLPIGIVSLALMLEVVRFFSPKKGGSGAGSLVLGAAAASSVMAVILGFLLYQGGGWEGSQLAESHMWRGIWFTAGTIVAFIFRAWADVGGGAATRIAFLSRLTLFGSAGMMGLASHDGGSLTHGEKYLTEEAPAPIRKILGLPPKEGKDGEEGGDTPGGAPSVPVEQQVVYTSLVAPILEKRCTNCHNADKSKGKLRLDTHEFILKGGKEGAALVAGDIEKSPLLARIHLPQDDDEHMPPKEKPQVQAHELAVLTWWVKNGGDPKKTVGELNPTPEIKDAIAKLEPAAKSIATGSAPAAKPGSTDEAHLTPGAPAGTSPGKAADPALKKQVAEYAKDFPGALTFESQQSPMLTFTAVSLRGNLDDAKFEKLVPVVKHLVTADLSATKVTDRSVALLSGAENLRMVRLSETGVTDGAMDTLVKLPKLESVNLYGTEVTDAGVMKLAMLPNLKRLYLWQTKVTPQGIDELKKKMPKCEIVTGA